MTSPKTSSDDRSDTGTIGMLWNHSAFVIAAILVCATGLLVSSPGLHNGEEGWGLPLAYFLRGEVPAPNDVVIVDIDDISNAKGLPKSMDVRGMNCNLSPGNKVRTFAGPMPRCLHAHLIDKIAAGSPDAIVIDVSFEKDGTPQEDAILAASIRDPEIVVLLRRIQTIIVESKQIVTEQLEDLDPEIADAAFAGAPFPLPKTTSLVNQFWSRTEQFGGLATLPTMALFVPFRDVLNDARGAQPMEDFVRDLLRSPRGAPTDGIKLDKQAQALIDRLRQSTTHFVNFFGRPGTVEIINAYDLIRSNTPPDLRNKTVFIGQVNLNTYQQADNFPTVYSQANGIDLAGVEIAATIFANLKHDTTLKRPTPWQSSLVLIAAGILMLAIAVRFPPHISLSIIPLLLVLYTILFAYAFSENHLWLPSLGLYAMAVAAVLLGASIRNYRSFRILIKFFPNRFQKLFEHNEAILDESVLDQPVKVRGLCVKCDIEGYTTASTQSDSDALGIAVHKFSSIAGKMVNEIGGDIFINGDDSVTLTWEFDRQDGKTWQKIVPVIFKISETPFIVETEQGPLTRRNRIGITYGPFSIAPMGGDGNWTLNAQGDVVNLAARLEDLNKKFGSRILAQADLAPHLSQVVIQDRGTFTPKGFDGEIGVIELKRLA